MKRLLWCGFGLLAGGIGGFVLGHRFGYQKALDDANELVDDVCEDMKRTIIKEQEEKEKVLKEAINSVYGAKEITEEKKPQINYQAIYEDVKNEEEEGGEMTEEEEWMEAHQKEMEDEPYIITFEEAEELPPYYKRETLFYWVDDWTLTTEDSEEPVDDAELLIGNTLDSGFKDNDEQIMFVRNPKLAICYEVEKINAAWRDTMED